MQVRSKGVLESYNSLTDDNLTGFFSNPRKLQHLQRMGLVTEEGIILDEETVRRYHARQEHQAKSKHLIAQGLVKKAVELEKIRRGKLKKKMEQLSKFELAEKIKCQSSFPFGVAYLNSTHSSPPLLKKTFEKHQDQLELSPGQHSQLSHMIDHMIASKLMRTSHFISPYMSRTNKPHPPSEPRPLTTTNMQIRSRRIQRPQTAPGTDRVHTNIVMTFQYLGDTVKLSRTFPLQNYIEVHQQHCRGNTVCLFKGYLRPQETFRCVSRRHYGMPLGLTLYINGLVNCRLSSCCEYKYAQGSLVGGKSANFRLVSVEGGKPCYQCEMDSIRTSTCMKKALVPITAKEITLPDKDKETPSHKETSEERAKNDTDDYEDEAFEEEEEEEEEEKYLSDFETHSQAKSTDSTPSHVSSSSHSTPKSKRTLQSDTHESNQGSSILSVPVIKLSSPDEAVVSEIVSTVMAKAIQRLEKEIEMKNESRTSNHESLTHSGLLLDLDSDDEIRQYLEGIIKRAKSFVAKEQSFKEEDNFDNVESDVSLNLPQRSRSSSSSSSSVSSFADQPVPQKESGRISRLEERQSNETIPSTQDEEQSKPHTNEQKSETNTGGGHETESVKKSESLTSISSGSSSTSSNKTVKSNTLLSHTNDSTYSV